MSNAAWKLELGWRLGVTNFDTVGATSLFTTVEDLARWDENFYTHKLGGEEFVKQMLHRDNLNDGTPQKYAFGLIVSTYRGLPTVEHAGADAGYRAILSRFPDQHFSVACLCNGGDTTEPISLAHKVSDIFLADQIKLPAPMPMPDSNKPNADQLRPFAGAYWNPNTDEIRIITLKDGVLRLLLEEITSVPLVPLRPNVYQPGNLAVELHVYSAAGNKPVTSDYGMPATFEMLPPFTLPADTLPEYVGTYLSDEVEPVYRVLADDGKLTLHRLKHKPEVLYPVAPDLFVADFGTARFIRDDQHRVSGVLVSSDRVYNLRFRRASD